MAHPTSRLVAGAMSRTMWSATPAEELQPVVVAFVRPCRSGWRSTRVVRRAPSRLRRRERRPRARGDGCQSGSSALSGAHCTDGMRAPLVAQYANSPGVRPMAGPAGGGPPQRRVDSPSMPRRRIPRSAPPTDSPPGWRPRSCERFPTTPVPGIVFRDITTAARRRPAFHEAVDAMAAAHAGARGRRRRGHRVARVHPRRRRSPTCSAPASCRSASRDGCPRPPCPSPTRSSTARPCSRSTPTPSSRGQRVLIVDDLLATGGTAAAAIELVEKLGGVVAGLAFLIELAALGGAAALGGHDHTRSSPSDGDHE